MKPKVKKLLSFLFILISVSVVIIIAFSNRELGNAWDAISQLSLPWIGGLLLCWFVYGFFEAMGTWNCLYNRGHRIRPLSVYWTVLIGMYYSNITPSAAGGQPMQVNSLRKAGIPVGYGTMAVTIRFFANQFIICFMSLVLFLFNRPFVYQQLGGVMWVVRVGWLINFSVIPLIVLATWKRNWIQKFGIWLISVLHKMHLVRNREASIAKVTEVLDTYNKAMHDLLKRPGQITIQFLCSLASLLAMTATVIFVYHAFGQHGTHWYQLLTLSCLLYVSASYTPLPGASGAQEGGFVVYFGKIFLNGTIGMALLTWRFFTFYLFLIVGVGMVLLEKVILKREKSRRLKELIEADDTETAVIPEAPECGGEPETPAE